MTSTVSKPEVPRWTARLSVAGDMGFVYDSWIRASSRTYPNMHATDFCTDERARVQRIVNASIVAVACLEADENELLGYAVYGVWRKVLALHYAYVKPEARRHGVLNSMLDFANYQRFPVVLTAPAVDPAVMSGLMKHHIYDQRVLPLMQRGGA